MSDEQSNGQPTAKEIEDMLYRLAAEYELDVNINVTLADDTPTTENESDES